MIYNTTLDDGNENAKIHKKKMSNHQKLKIYSNHMYLKIIEMVIQIKNIHMHIKQHANLYGKHILLKF